MSASLYLGPSDLLMRSHVTPRPFPHWGPGMRSSSFTIREFREKPSGAAVTCTVPLRLLGDLLHSQLTEHRYEKKNPPSRGNNILLGQEKPLVTMGSEMHGFGDELNHCNICRPPPSERKSDLNPSLPGHDQVLSCFSSPIF